MKLKDKGREVEAAREGLQALLEGARTVGADLDAAKAGLSEVRTGYEQCLGLLERRRLRRLMAANQASGVETLRLSLIRWIDLGHN